MTTMAWLFSGAAQFDQPIGDWDTSSHHDHHGRRLPTRNISSWDVGTVTNMNNMFGGDCPLNCPARWCQSDFNGIIQKQHTPCYLALRLGVVSIK